MAIAPARYRHGAPPCAIAIDAHPVYATTPPPMSSHSAIAVVIALDDSVMTAKPPEASRCLQRRLTALSATPRAVGKEPGRRLRRREAR